MHQASDEFGFYNSQKLLTDFFLTASEAQTGGFVWSAANLQGICRLVGTSALILHQSSRSLLMQLCT